MFILKEEILLELKHNSKVKFKETDLFRVYQSIDLVRMVYRISINSMISYPLYGMMCRSFIPLTLSLSLFTLFLA